MSRSLSLSSNETQAVASPGLVGAERWASHSTASDVLPYPAGADMRMRPCDKPWSSWASRRGRVTYPSRNRGGRSLVLINVGYHAVELRTVLSQDHYSIKGMCRSGRLGLTRVNGLRTQVKIDRRAACWRQVITRLKEELNPFSISKKDGDSFQQDAGKLSEDKSLDK